MLPHLMSYTVLATNHHAELARHARSARQERVSPPAAEPTPPLLRSLQPRTQR